MEEIILYTKIVDAVKATIKLIKFFSKSHTADEAAHKERIVSAIYALQEAIRATLDNIEEDYKKYSNDELAGIWKKAGDKIIVIPYLSREAFWIFQKESYIRRGRKPLSEASDKQKLKLEEFNKTLGLLYKKLK
jgi:hypothetical protein